MDELSSGVERRRALRVPVRGVAMLDGDDGRVRATLENLSKSGVLLTLPSLPTTSTSYHLEVRMLGGGGWIHGRTARIERERGNFRVAVEFADMDAAMGARIDAAIDAALSTVKSRPILVIDDRHDRRIRLMAELAKRGLTPIAPRTPLEAIDCLTRPQLHVDICMLGDGFDLAATEFAAVLSDSFPWVTTAEIDDDVDATANRAFDAWASSPVARMATAVG